MFSNKNLLSCVLLLLLGHSHHLFASSDTLLYRSPFEARLIEGTINKKNADFFALFLSINSDSATYARHSATLDRFYVHLDKKLSAAKPGKQQAKVIFNEVHTWFFKQYEEHVLIDGIFNNGIYNCLTASMLYALVLDKYNIPYEVKEKPTHIYLVSFPGTENIMFETTNPRGLYIPDDRTKRDYVSSLVSMKLTTQEYVNSVGIAQAFNEFYYNSQNITLQQLAGLQYSNQALALHETKDIDGAIKSIRKAEMLYSCARNQYIKRALIMEVLANSEFESLKDISYLAEHANAASEIQDRKQVLAAFGGLLETNLLKNGQYEFVTQAHDILVKNIQNEKLRTDIRYNYEHAVTYWFYMKNDNDQAMVHAEKAYAINTSDVRIQELILRIVMLKVEQQINTSRSPETLPFQAYAEKFPFLSSNKQFRMLIVMQYAFQAYESFSKNQPTEGYQHMARMEQVLKISDADAISQQRIGMVYAEAGAYHFRRKEYAKARGILRKGLGFVPNHSEIKERLRIVDSGEARPD